MIYLYPEKLDILGDKAGPSVYLNSALANKYGINEGDIVELHYHDFEIGAEVILTDTIVNEKQVGITESLWRRYRISGLDYITLIHKVGTDSLEYIKKKLTGGTLNQQEMNQIIKDVALTKLSVIEMTYFCASLFSPGLNEDEIYFMTKAIAESGDSLSFKELSDVVVDKHSIGGIPSKGVTPIMVSIIASLGYVIPNTSSRAITAPAGTADMLEVVMPVSLGKEEIEAVVKKNNGCLVWGGGLNLAPADDILIQIEKPIHLETYANFITSIMAKKVASGITHQLIDIPYGVNGKVKEEDLEEVSKLFENLGRKFKIKVGIYSRNALAPDGMGIGPTLEIRDALWCLERNPKRPTGLENLAIDMSAKLMELTGKIGYRDALFRAREALDSGLAFQKFWDIAFSQGATYIVKGDDLELATNTYEIKAKRDGVISMFRTGEIVKITRALGTPYARKAGILLNRTVGDRVRIGDVIATLYAENSNRLQKGVEAFEKVERTWIEYK